MSNPLLRSYSSCFVFTKHPVQLNTVMTCFQNVFFQKRAPKQKGGCLDTLDTPGSATVITACTVVGLQAVVKANSQSDGKGKFRPRILITIMQRLTRHVSVIRMTNRRRNLEYTTTVRRWCDANPYGTATTWVVSANTFHVTCFGF